MVSPRISFKAAVALFLFAVLVIPGRAQTSDPPPSPPNLSGVQKQIKQITDVGMTLRAELDRLKERLDAVDKLSQQALSEVPAVIGVATAYIYACTAMIIIATAILGLAAAKQFLEFRQLQNDIRTLLQSTETKLEKVRELEQRLEQEVNQVRETVKQVRETNKHQEAKLEDLEKGRQLVTEMKAVTKSHQPPNKIKREIIALLLLHEDWPTAFRREITKALGRWNGDGEEAIAPEIANAVHEPSPAPEKINPQGSQKQP